MAAFSFSVSSFVAFRNGYGKVQTLSALGVNVLKFDRCNQLFETRFCLKNRIRTPYYAHFRENQC